MPSPRILIGLVVCAIALPAAADNTTPTLQNKLAQCQGCHGIADWKTAYPEVYHVPKLGGQKAAYIVAALKEYKSGAREFATMHAMTTELSDQDMQDLANHFAGNQGAGAPAPAAPAAAEGKK